MANFVQSEVESIRDEIVRRISSGEGTYAELVEAFPDPAEAYVHCPVQLSIRQLARLYGEEVPEDERHQFPGVLRRRMRDDRWVEKRAQHQAQRHSTRRDAIIDAEAQVWAVLGLEFHVRRIRSMWERWEMLDGHVTDCLERIESGVGQFTTNLRDAMKELSAVEVQLAELMPRLGIPDAAMKKWNEQAGSRSDLIRRAASALEAVEGNDQAGNVYSLVDHINGESNEGGG